MKLRWCEAFHPCFILDEIGRGTAQRWWVVPVVVCLLLIRIMWSEWWKVPSFRIAEHIAYASIYRIADIRTVGISPIDIFYFAKQVKRLH